MFCRGKIQTSNWSCAWNSSLRQGTGSHWEIRKPWRHVGLHFYSSHRDNQAERFQNRSIANDSFDLPEQTTRVWPWLLQNCQVLVPSRFAWKHFNLAWEINQQRQCRVLGSWTLFAGLPNCFWPGWQREPDLYKQGYSTFEWTTGSLYSKDQTRSAFEDPKGRN